MTTKSQNKQYKIERKVESTLMIENFLISTKCQDILHDNENEFITNDNATEQKTTWRIETIKLN